MFLSTKPSQSSTQNDCVAYDGDNVACVRYCGQFQLCAVRVRSVVVVTVGVMVRVLCDMECSVLASLSLCQSWLFTMVTTSDISIVCMLHQQLSAIMHQDW